MAEQIRDNPRTDSSESGESKQSPDKEDVQATVHHLKDEGRAFVEQRKLGIASNVEAVGRALHSGCDTLRGSDETLSRIFDRLGSECEQFAQYLKDTRPERLIQVVGKGMRRRPELLLGGLFLGGLVLARTLKAANLDSNEDRDEGEEESLHQEDPDFPGYTRPTTYGDESFDANRARSTQAFANRPDADRFADIDDETGGKASSY